MTTSELPSAYLRYRYPARSLDLSAEALLESRLATSYEVCCAAEWLAVLQSWAKPGGPKAGRPKFPLAGSGRRIPEKRHQALSPAFLHEQIAQIANSV